MKIYLAGSAAGKGRSLLFCEWINNRLLSYYELSLELFFIPISFCEIVRRKTGKKIKL